ncbi:hypothetical protein Tco_0059210 [Tanacetum coccineum]
MSSSTPAVSSDIAELKDMVRALILDKKNQTPAPAPVKAVEQSCVTCGGGHSYQICPATDGNIYCDNIQEYVSQAAAPYQALAPVPPSPGVSKSDFDNYVKANDAVMQNMQNQMANPKGDVKEITTRSGVSYNGPQTSSLPKEMENEPDVTKDTRTLSYTCPNLHQCLENSTMTKIR